MQRASSGDKACRKPRDCGISWHMTWSVITNAYRSWSSRLNGGLCRILLVKQLGVASCTYCTRSPDVFWAKHTLPGSDVTNIFTL